LRLCACGGVYSLILVMILRWRRFFWQLKQIKKGDARPENETSPNNAQQKTTSSLNKSTTIFFIFRIFFLISWFLGSNMLR